jgi:hypothetical protein
VQGATCESPVLVGGMIRANGDMAWRRVSSTEKYPGVDLCKMHMYVIFVPLGHHDST